VITNFEDYLGVVSERIIRKNIVYLYELMNELLDGGIVQLATVNELNNVILPPANEDESIFNIKIGNAHKTNANASKRSIFKGKLEF